VTNWSPGANEARITTANWRSDLRAPGINSTLIELKNRNPSPTCVIESYKQSESIIAIARKPRGIK
jgi:hypothetical protein